MTRAAFVVTGSGTVVTKIVTAVTGSVLARCVASPACPVAERHLFVGSRDMPSQAAEHSHPDAVGEGVYQFVGGFVGAVRAVNQNN